MSGYNYTWSNITHSDSGVGLFSSDFYGGKYSTDFLGDITLTDINNETQTINTYGVAEALSPSSDLIRVPASGRALTWEEVESIPVGTSVDDAVDLFAVRYPYYEDNNYKYHLMVCKAYRETLQENRRIGSFSPAVYGSYTVINLSFYSRIGMNGVQTEDIRLGTAPVRCYAYKPNTGDVTTSVTHLEFFYASRTTGAWDDNIQQVFIGVSNECLAGSNKSCNYRLWAPKMYNALICYTAYFGTFSPENNPYDPEFGTESGIGGYDDPTHDFSSDDITPSPLPTLSVLSPGFVNVYKVTSGLLTQLGSAIFPENPLSMDATGLTEVQALLKCFRYLIDDQHNKGAIDFIIDCHILPVDVPAGASANISCGGKILVNPDTHSNYSAPRVSASYVTKSCGSLSIGECFGNFLDYTVRCKLYLPFYGYVDIPAEYWNGGTISVDYAFNIIDGTFIAYVKGKAKHSKLNSLIGQYAGVAVTHIPIRGADYSQVVSGLIMTGAGIAGSVATGGASALLTGGAMASGLGQMLASKPALQTNGSSNSSSAMMMHKKPYLIIEYPSPQFSSSYPSESGLPLNVSEKLGHYGGMTIAENPILDGIPCTESEKERIKNALKTGLIFR